MCFVAKSSAQEVKSRKSYFFLFVSTAALRNRADICIFRLWQREQYEAIEFLPASADEGLESYIKKKKEEKKAHLFSFCMSRDAKSLPNDTLASKWAENLLQRFLVLKHKHSNHKTAAMCVTIEPTCTLVLQSH